MPCSPSVVIAVPGGSPPTSKLAIWSMGWWSFVPATHQRHAPTVGGGPTGGGLENAGAETGNGVGCRGWWVCVWKVEPGLAVEEGWLVGVVGGEGDVVKHPSEEEVCSDGISLPVLLPELRSDLRRSRKVAAPPHEGGDKVGDGVGGAAG